MDATWTDTGTRDGANVLLTLVQPSFGQYYMLSTTRHIGLQPTLPRPEVVYCH